MYALKNILTGQRLFPVCIRVKRLFDCGQRLFDNFCMWVFDLCENEMIMFCNFEMRRMPITMLEEVQQDPIPQAMHVLLSEVLQQVPVRASRVLWEQSRVPLLQQLEDQGRRPQVPLNSPMTTSLLLTIYLCFLLIWTLFCWVEDLNYFAKISHSLGVLPTCERLFYMLSICEISGFTNIFALLFVRGWWKWHFFFFIFNEIWPL